MDKLFERIIRAVLIGGITIRGEVRIEFNQKPLTYHVECPNCHEIFVHNNEVSAKKSMTTHLARWCPALRDPQWEPREASEWPDWIVQQHTSSEVEISSDQQESSADGTE